MLAAEAAVRPRRPGARRTGAYPAAFEQSWLHAELDRARNFKQWFKKGNTVGSMMTGIEQWLLPKLGIKSPPWTCTAPRPTTAGCTRPTRSRRSATPSPTAC
jgi:electron-transferring-flavoprotein dehydrogenase